MKAGTLTILLLASCHMASAQKGVAQTDTTKSVYGKLVTRKFYPKHPNWQGIKLCTPCILETYGPDGKLLHKGIQYTDCPVGYRIEYFPSGKAKLTGHYKENDSGNWDNAYERGFCRRDGIWTYFNEAGRKLYAEHWKDGQFLKQTPEQLKPEVWTVQLNYNGADAANQTFTLQQFSAIKLTPKFKNRITTGITITGELRISAIGYRVIEKKFALADFNALDVQNMLSQTRIPADKLAECTITIFVDGTDIGSYSINIKQ